MYDQCNYIIQIINVLMITHAKFVLCKGSSSNDTTSKANTTHENINEIIQLIKTINMKAIKCQVTVNTLSFELYCF